MVRSLKQKVDSNDQPKWPSTGCGICNEGIKWEKTQNFISHIEPQSSLFIQVYFHFHRLLILFPFSFLFFSTSIIPLSTFLILSCLSVKFSSSKFSRTFYLIFFSHFQLFFYANKIRFHLPLFHYTLP